MQAQVSRRHSHEMEDGGGERNYGLNCVPAKDILISQPPEPENVTLLGNRVFAAVSS